VAKQSGKKAIVFDKDNGYIEMAAQWQGAKGGHVLVGFPNAEPYPDSDMTVASVAMINEFGSESAGIPERPFMRTTYIENARKIEQTIDKLVAKWFEGRISEALALKVIGQQITNMMKAKLRAGPWVPNAPSTIARKGSSKPLIDTGLMLKSIAFKVKTGRSK